MQNRLVLIVSLFSGILAILGISQSLKFYPFEQTNPILVFFFPSSLFLYITSVNYTFHTLYLRVMSLTIFFLITFYAMHSIASLSGIHLNPQIYLQITTLFEIILAILFRCLTATQPKIYAFAFLLLLGSAIANLILPVQHNKFFFMFYILMQFVYWSVLFNATILYLHPHFDTIAIDTLFLNRTSSLKENSNIPLFHQIIQVILSSEGTSTHYKTVVESAKQLFVADYGLLGLYDHKKRIISDVITSETADSTSCRFRCQRIMDTVSLTRLPLKMNSAHPASPYFFSPGNSKQSYLALPIATKGLLYGVLIIGNLYTDTNFTDADVETGILFAAYTALIIRNDLLIKNISYRAQTDFLTGLFNYRHIIEAANIEINRANRHNHPLTAIMFDIDHFKAVNDSYGHTAGDLVLCSIAELCLQLFRNIDIVCRYGGEEFFVLLPETSVETAREVAERLRVSVQNKVTEFHKKQIIITISIGISCISSSCTTINRLIERADTALYCAKKSGRNRTVVWSPSMRTVAFDHVVTSQPHKDAPSL